MGAPPPGSPSPFGAPGRPMPLRLALRWPEEVAQALGISVDTAQRWGLGGQLRMVRMGRIRLVPVFELERWLRECAALPLGELEARR